MKLLVFIFLIGHSLNCFSQPVVLSKIITILELSRSVQLPSHLDTLTSTDFRLLYRVTFENKIPSKIEPVWSIPKENAGGYIRAGENAILKATWTQVIPSNEKQSYGISIWLKHKKPSPSNIHQRLEYLTTWMVCSIRDKQPNRQELMTMSGKISVTVKPTVNNEFIYSVDDSRLSVKEKAAAKDFITTISKINYSYFADLFNVESISVTVRLNQIVPSEL